MQVSDEHFRGRTVIAADGKTVDEVGTIFFDTSSWLVVAFQIKLHKAVAEQLGEHRGILRAATIELPVRMVQSVGDSVLLSLPTHELRQSPPEADDRHEKNT